MTFAGFVVLVVVVTFFAALASLFGMLVYLVRALNEYEKWEDHVASKTDLERVDDLDDWLYQWPD